ncbi:MAG: ferredoxin [Bacillota bacterium]
MKVEVDQELCISCGLCVDTCPEVFGWNDDEKAYSMVDSVPEPSKSCAMEALDNCPTEAIKAK